ncbi:MAG: isocitrate/isopropylmalate dehydrogenase family protein [Alphaproteobacteria bacterium]|nr:isocitrate/isopropylmalate dehydrogenase family protein [Alphaproteobacteria bacterium]
MKNSAFRIVAVPGDGIGLEVMKAARAVLDAVTAKFGGFALDFQELPGGAHCYRHTGTAISEESFTVCGQADAILFGAMGWPDIRYADGTEIAPQLDLRVRLGLYAGARPIRAIPRVPTALADPRAQGIDLVILRESTEGMFASRGRGEVIDDREARDTQVITRATSGRLFDFTLKLADRRRARGRPGLATVVDKSNVFRSFAFFRKIFHQRAQDFPHLQARHHYIDAMALDLARRPWDFDVIVTENLFGDILSDLAAGLVGGMGFDPSADIGDDPGLFQSCHGSAPDIAGRGLANPTAMLLSAAMMLEWLGERHSIDQCVVAARVVEQAIDRVFSDRRACPPDLGGTDGTAAVTRAVITAL